MPLLRAAHRHERHINMHEHACLFKYKNASIAGGAFLFLFSAHHSPAPTPVPDKPDELRMTRKDGHHFLLLFISTFIRLVLIAGIQ